MIGAVYNYTISPVFDTLFLRNQIQEMASFSQLNQFPCRILLKRTPSDAKFSSLTPSFLSLSSNKTNPTRNNSILKSRTMVNRELTKTRPVFLVKAVDEDEVKLNEIEGIDSMKRKLVDLFHGTGHGQKANSETSAEVVELIAQLEARNPNPAPTEALPLLNGKWILVSTSFAGLFPSLSVTLPLVKVEEISQTIDSNNFTVQNSVQFSVPLATTSISAHAKFEVRSPKRVQIKFEQGIFGAPKLTENVEFMGNKIDVTLLRAMISYVEDIALSIAKIISSHLPVMFSISNNNAESWLLITYLDNDLRISRGDADSVFVLIKEGSSLFTPEQT